MVAGRPDLIFHLAAIVSGEAEADFDKGYRVNLDATRNLLEAIRAANARDGLPAAARLRLVHRRVRRAVPRQDPRRFLLDAADELRDAEGARRAPAFRLFPKGVPRRDRHPAADRLHPPGQAQQGRVGFLLHHPARAAERTGGDAACLRGRPALAREPALGGGILPARGDDGSRAARVAAQSYHAGPLGDGGRADCGPDPGRGSEGRRAHPPRSPTR